MSAPDLPEAHPLRQLLDRLPPSLRLHALTHPAWAHTHNESFERLEFLGDSVLGCMVTVEIFTRYPDLSEGDMSKVRAATVSREACAEVGLAAGLGEALRVAAPQHADAALVASLGLQSRVVAALTESVIGAAFLEFGYDAVNEVVVASFADRIGHALDNRNDAKSQLQELAQGRGDSVEYRVVSVDGPDHDRRFTMVARLERSGLEATGSGRSKKAAAQVAAGSLLDTLARQEG
jgi:ribonuclease-3